MALPEFLVPIGFEQVTVSTTAVGLTATTYAPAGRTPADYAVITIESNAIRYRDDGANPTAAVGMPGAVAQVITVSGPQSIKNIRFIRQSADAMLSAAYYRYGGS